MATIRLNRTSAYVNRLRNYSVVIDGQKVGTIADGESKAFDVSPGRHSIVTTIDWCSSPTITFDISDDEVKNFQAGGFKQARWLMPTTLLVFFSSYLVNWKFGLAYVFYIAIPAFLFFIYYLTVGRNQYLSLAEKKTGILVETAKR